MNFNLTKEQELIQKAAQEFAEKYLDPIAKQIDEENRVPDEIVKMMADLDLLGIPFPEEYGGAGAGYSGFVLAMEQLACASSGAAHIVTVNALGMGAINRFGSEEQKRKYLPGGCKGELFGSFAFTEPGTGSDPKQITTTAKKDGNNYILNGTKRFISNAVFKGPMVTFARDEDTGRITAYIVDKFCEGYSVSEPWNKIGTKGGLLVDVYLKDVKVPAENVLGEPGNGFPLLLYGISYGKVGVSSHKLGGALAAYREAVKYALEKTHRGEPIAKFQAIKLAIAEIAEKYEACKWVVYRLGFLADTMKDPVQFAKESALTKDFVCETTIDLTRKAMNVHGSYGLMKDYKIESLWRDCIMGAQIEGVSDMQKIIVANYILGQK
ncbi:MAG: acyl-CoA dehydrogenase family protein [Syntrophomonadaceae bacterium]|jgi:alkylation response protein AidB-like acyl-CoA dehydrogenase